MGVFGPDGSLQQSVHAPTTGGSINWAKTQSYAGAYQAPIAQPAKQPQITLGTVANSFLSGLQHAVTHPVQTAVDLGKSIVSSAVNDAKTVASLPVNAAKGVYHLGAAGAEAVMGNKQAAMQHIAQLNKDYQNSYIGKTYGSKSPGDLSGLGNAASFGLDAATSGLGGSLIKQGVKAVAKTGGESLLKAAGKGAAKGAAENAAIGAGYGGAQSLQQNDVSVGNLAKNAGVGAATGAVAGAGLGAVSHALGAAINKWVGLRTQTAAAEHSTPQAALPSGEKQLALPSGEKPTALPAGEKPAQIGATSSANPVKTTPGGGVTNLNAVSPETAAQITRLNQTLHNYSIQGAHPNEVTQLGVLAAMRANAAKVVDGIAQDRAAAETSQGGNPQELLAHAHQDLATAKDPQALHYQQATEVAKAADAAYKAHEAKVGGKSVNDVSAPKITDQQASVAKSKLANAQAQAGKERLGEAKSTPLPTPTHSAEQLQGHLAAIQSGHAPGSEIVALNNLIEHPDVSAEDKAHYIQQRDALKPSAKSEPAPAEATPSAGEKASKSTAQTDTPATAARKEKAASLTQTKRQPVYADDYVETKSKAEVKADNQAALKQRLVQDFKKKQAANAKKDATAKEELTRPVGKASDVTAPSGTRAEKLYDRATGGKGSGLINPSRAASRAGNVGLSRTATNLVSSKRQVTYVAKQTRSEFGQLAKGLKHDDINAVVEGGKTDDPRVQAAANFYMAHRDAIGARGVEAGTLKGQKENYLSHVANGLSNRAGRAGGLGKNTRFNIERQSIEHINSAGEVVKEDKYKTLDEFDAAVKKLDPKASAERDTGKLLEHMLIKEGHAIENAKTSEALMNTRMTDGRPALARMTEANMNSQKLKDYVVVDNKLVHPDAKNLYEAITKTGRVNNPFASALSKTNVFSKRLVTLNGVVHAVKIWQSSFAAQGVARSLWAIGSRGASKEDFIRALGYGAKFARASNDNLFDEVGKATGVLGKMEKLTDPLTHALFHKFGDRQGMSTYKYIEGKLLKKGLSADEAGRIAADGANQVMHFVPEDQQSIVVRQASQLALFAGQFLQNTMKTATNAAGVGLDRTLSKEGQQAAQKLAIARISRMFAYSFAASQALNLATTGKYTWQNGNGDPLNPIWFQTRSKGYTKSYRITNMYGQLKDVFGLITNPAGEIQNKLAPGARELVSQVANNDLFTGNKIAPTNQNEAQQLMDRMIHAASNIFTPFGINASSPSKQPWQVNTARAVGFNSSSVAANDKTDYAKLATDKAAAQKLEDAYKKGDQSKLAAMQALKASGNDYFDKFFASNPTLDPTNSSFKGWQANNSKQVSAAISAGFDEAKKNGTTLSYMQSIQQSGSQYFSKFFAAHQNLDPTSSSFDGTGTKAKTQANKARSASNRYAAKSTRYAAQKYTRSKGGKSASLTRPSKKALTAAVAPTKARKSRTVGLSSLTRSKKMKL